MLHGRIHGWLDFLFLPGGLPATAGLKKRKRPQAGRPQRFETNLVTLAMEQETVPLHMDINFPFSLSGSQAWNEREGAGMARDCVPGAGGGFFMVPARKRLFFAISLLVTKLEPCHEGKNPFPFGVAFGDCFSNSSRAVP